MSCASSASEWRLDGRVCLLTGATAGIGRATAHVLASLGADLVLVGRSRSRLKETVKSITHAMPGVKITAIVVDLSSQAEIRHLATRVLEEVPRLHVLINHAAVVTMRRDETVDGIERQFAVNHLASFLLTNLLLDRLSESAPARVVMVASHVERDGSINLADLQGRDEYDGWRAYRQSKLANIMFAEELARREAGRGITPISLHPGVYATELAHVLMGWSKIMTRLRGRSLPGPDAAAYVLARAVAAPELKGDVAIHLNEHEVATPSVQARDAPMAAALWTECARLSGIDT